jgi:uncharacterized membrane protein YkvI
MEVIMGKLTMSDITGPFHVANVYNAAIVGPLMIIGSLATVYYIPFGMWCVLLPLISFGVFGVVFACGVEFPRRYQCYDYLSMAKIVYGKYSKFCVPIIDLYLPFSYTVGLTIYMAIIGPFMQESFNIAPVPGMILCSVLSLLMTIYRDTVVRYAATIMTVAMLVCCVILAYYFYLVRGDILLEMIRTFYVPEGVSLLSAIYLAVTYGLSSAGTAFGLSCISQPIKKKAQSILVGVFSFIGCSLFTIICNLYYVGFIPEILTEPAPASYILNTFIYNIAPWVVVVYVIVMLSALISSMVPNLFILTTRLDQSIPSTGILANHKVKFFILGCVWAGIAIAFSLLGLQTVLIWGLGILAWVGMPLIVIPLVFIWPFIHRKRDREALGTTQDAKLGV